MFPTFHMNNFKPWTPPYTKSFSPRKSFIHIPPIANKPPPPKPYHDSLPSTLPFPKHHLPVQPPTKVYIYINITYIPIKLPFFQEDTMGDSKSSASIYSLDNSLKKSSRLPSLHNNIPINPVILADDRSWSTSSLHQSVHNHPHIQGHQQLHSSHHNSKSNMSCSNSTNKNLHSKQSKITSKRYRNLKTSSQITLSFLCIANYERFLQHPSLSFPVSTT
ncbi:hypothetical protein BDV25DRAFT_172487 [Aspergillus avenaceus]|uniref:Uncharacterized protein n=1 Tax=Aspergillus avenaceus TaxID=36643 RepID=A0A5N6TUJ4_ASPAV|nr:hypothetical protein BDV25DRAFT_172487 [Aspergillus avenaceus]